MPQRELCARLQKTRHLAHDKNVEGSRLATRMRAVGAPKNAAIKNTLQLFSKVHHKLFFAAI
jgi:fructose-specific phosphotransferase system component IIB